MTVDISDRLISRLSDFVTLKTGLYFPREKWRDLKRNILAAAPDLGFQDPEQCVRWILSGRLTKEQADSIIAHLTIGETFFFRDHAVFADLKDHVLTPWARSRKGSQRRIRFWSAACSSGEEPYSIAILLDQMKDLFHGWEITILATDINARSIEKAKKGIYTRWSFRNLPEGLMAQYFTEVGKNRFELASHIRDRVRFSRLNLIEEGAVTPTPAAGPVDVVFCRNVLMYLSPDMRQRVIHRLSTSLAEGGWLIVSPAEAPLVEVPTLHPIRFPGAVFHKKGAFITVEQGAVKAPGHVAAHEDRAGPAVFPPAFFPVAPIPHERPSPLRPTPVRPQREHPHETGRNPYQEAVGLHEKGLYQEAADKLEGLLSVEGAGVDPPDQTQVMMLLARAYADSGRLEEARKWGERAVATEKLDPEIHSLLAAIYQELGLTEEPIRALKHVVYLDPDRVMAYFSLGHLLRRQGKPEEAKRFFTGARDLLAKMNPEEMVPHSDGLTAGSILDAVDKMI